MANDEFSEFNRTVSEITITEEGIFHKGEVPDDVEGTAELDLEVVHAVQLTNSKGELMIFHFDVPKAKNNQRSETPYSNKKAKNSTSDNTMQSGKLNQNKIDKGNAMKSLLNVGDNT